ncbi:hypothetical protein NFI95_01420 [Acetobacteraceae bacterium KSS8]|uniref:Uncharacterized protein n=1 Tax=Endosaccharibacter trunci TaxID=2812733 RepID=A0ABT1W3W1_9PROT|nr:hypothetical protein [Acetobacteraceae bacterium KSS8]
MAFDGSNFREPELPKKKPAASENVLTGLVLVLLLGMLILPVSAAGLRDVALYLGLE